MVNINSAGSGSRCVAEHFPCIHVNVNGMSLQRLQNSNLPWMNSLVKLVPLLTTIRRSRITGVYGTHLSFIEVAGLWSWKSLRVFVAKSCVATSVYILHSNLQIARTMPYNCMYSLSSWLCCIILRAILGCSLHVSCFDRFVVACWKPWLLGS